MAVEMSSSPVYSRLLSHKLNWSWSHTSEWTITKHPSKFALILPELATSCRYYGYYHRFVLSHQLSVKTPVPAFLTSMHNCIRCLLVLSNVSAIGSVRCTQVWHLIKLIRVSILSCDMYLWRKFLHNFCRKLLQWLIQNVNNCMDVSENSYLEPVWSIICKIIRGLRDIISLLVSSCSGQTHTFGARRHGDLTIEVDRSHQGKCS